MKKCLSLADLPNTINVYEDEVRLGILSGANEEVFTGSFQRKATLQNLTIKKIIVMATTRFLCGFSIVVSDVFSNPQKI